MRVELVEMRSGAKGTVRCARVEFVRDGDEDGTIVVRHQAKDPREGAAASLGWHIPADEFVPDPAEGVRREAHGYASDVDALRVFASQWSEATIAALGDYYGSPDATTKDASLALCRRWVLTRKAADDVGAIWARVAHRAEEARAAALEAELVALTVGAHAPPSHQRWGAAVAADLRARLAGDVGRPLPEADTTEEPDAAVNETGSGERGEECHQGTVLGGLSREVGVSDGQ